MAQLDTRIPLAVQPPDFLGGYERGLTIRDLMDKRQMVDEERQAQRTLADLYRGNTGADGAVSREGLVRGLAGAGLGERIPGVQKQFADADKAQLDLKNTQSQIGERDFGVMKKKLDATGAALHSLLEDPNATPADAMAKLQGLVNAGIMTPEEGAAHWREVPTGSPQKFRSHLMQKGLQIADNSKRLEMLTPKVDVRDIGGSLQQFSTNSLTGHTTAGPQLAQKTATPGETMTDARTRSEGAANRAITMRGQNMADARSRDELALGGKAPPGYRWAEGGRLEAIPGGPGDKLPEAQQKQVVGVNNVRNAIAEYRAALADFGRFDTLRPDERAKMGTKYQNMLLQAKEAYNLGVLNGPDFKILQEVITSPLGVKGAITSKDALDQQASELDRIMAGVGETSSQRRPQDAVRPQSGATPRGGVPVPIKSDGDYNALPSGTRFRAPDGSIRVKP